MPDWRLAAPPLSPPSPVLPALFAHLVFVQTAVSGEEVVAEEAQRGAAAGAGEAERVERPILCALRARREREINTESAVRGVSKTTLQGHDRPNV